MGRNRGRSFRPLLMSLILAVTLVLAVSLMGSEVGAASKKSAGLKVGKTKYKLTTDSKAFRLKVTKKTKAKLKFASADTNVVKVSKKGKVKVKGIGSTKITVSVKATKKYKAGSKTIKVRVAKKQKLTLKDKKDEKIIQPVGADYQLRVTSNAGDSQKLTFKSSDSSKVSVDDKGLLSFKKMGDAVITVKAADTGDYYKTSLDIPVYAAQGQPVITTKEASYKINFLDDPVNMKAKSNFGLPLLYSSSDKTIVKVSKKGKLTPVGVGKATVTIRSEAVGDYKEAVLKVPVQITKGKQEIIVDKDNYQIDFSDTEVSLSARCTSALTPKFKSSDKTIVKVSKKGKLIPVAVGSAQVTISQAGNKNFKKAANKTLTVIVADKIDIQARRDAAVAWAVAIAKDNSFTYGAAPRSHRYGCYFCGTNTGPVASKKEKSGEAHYLTDSNGTEHSYDKTYCCNPFVHAAYAHGAQDPVMLKACRKGSGVGTSASTFTRYGGWKNIKKPGFKKLLPGDVFVKKGQHVALYCGGEYVAEAARSGWDAGSIPYHKAAKSRYSSCSYVMRYVGKEKEGDKDDPAREETQETGKKQKEAE